ncbi:isoquinoline 1-oxidoreductase, beta subunit [Devosia enhydra]|uniref:Isoquinoline 1-oxidoreductase, beta subunit n=1 Tax=Devosia enhydra TaxID=665118 RepID=A0A1K2HZ24_9HYPH|nr:molybdopterin cofactor-binding domain-containing protein [Devosia enhydra]SFZ85300.1 isoquinoline 1-oxidoreductase, beta subunit [Devosia enhydra]
MALMGKLAIRHRPLSVNRRQFVLSTLALGGGLMIGLTPYRESMAATSAKPWEGGEGTEFTAYLSIGPDNIVTVRSTTPDIGNGTFTANPMIISEELPLDWSLVRGEYIPPERDLAEGGKYSTSGYLAYFSGRSTEPEKLHELLQLAASTRERLRQAAAEEWSAAVADVTVEEGRLRHADGRTLTYGEVAEKAATVELAEEPAPKPRADWAVLGKQSRNKLQMPMIMNGSTVYGIDLKLPGMVYAALRQSPVQGGRLKSYDFEAVRGLSGVRGVAVVDPDEPRAGLPEGFRAPFGLTASQNGPQAAIAVIADSYWEAQTALDLMPVEWEAGEGARWTSTQTFYDHLSDRLTNPVDPNIVVAEGDAEAEIGDAADVEAEFLTPYMDHFTMEPLNGTALVEADRLEMWLPTQHTQQALFVGADETGLHPEKVLVNQTWVGTGFGRRVYNDDTRMVVAVAKTMPGVPVKVVWSREESMRQGRYRQVMAGRFTAKLDESGMPKAIKSSIAGAGAGHMGIANSPYRLAVPNWLIQTQNVNSNLLTGPWRGPGWNSNCFMLESFINQCAEKAGIDAIEYRKTLLAEFEDPAWIRLLDLVKEKSGWGTDQGRGIAQGVAIGNWGMGGYSSTAPVGFSGTTVATVVTAEVSRRGDIYIPRVDLAVDLGSLINEDAVRQMLEGGVVMTLGAAMHEEINLNNGRVVEGNLDSYRLARQNDPSLPLEIHVHFEGLSNGERFSEAGEPPMGPPPPALAHAVYKLTGQWLNRMPFGRQNLA